MPRTRIKATAYKKNDLPKFIRHKLATEEKKQSDLADLLGISPAAFTNRMHKGLFSYTDLVEIFAEVGATDDEIIRLMRKDRYK